MMPQKIKSAVRFAFKCLRGMTTAAIFCIAAPMYVMCSPIWIVGAAYNWANDQHDRPFKSHFYWLAFKSEHERERWLESGKEW